MQAHQLIKALQEADPNMPVTILLDNSPNAGREHIFPVESVEKSEAVIDGTFVPSMILICGEEM